MIVLYIQLATRNIWRQRRRMGVVALTMVVGTLLVLAGLAFINGMERNWLDLVAGTMVGDLGVTSGDDGEPAVFNTSEVVRAARGGEIAYVTERVEFDGIITRGDASAPATVRGVDVTREDRLVRTTRNREGDLLGLSGSTGRTPVALSKKMATDLQVRAGDEVELLGTALNGERFREKLTVAYIFEGSIRNAALDLWALLPLPDARRLIGAGEGEATSVRVFLRDRSPAAFSAVESALDRAAQGHDLRVQSWHETEESAWMTSVRIWKGILYSFVGLLSLLIIIGAFGVISATVLERTSEVGTMRALGMTPVQV
ncbi:MAG: hypothetical protein M1565_01950, partial [Actinobacteria bacterium]|nr:hypothetical protein [Actinomycetota bacterium]